MLLLLPPSEGKNAGQILRANANINLVFPQLTAAREAVRKDLVATSKKPKTALPILKLSEKQKPELAENQILETAKVSPAIEIYSGVVYEAIDFPTLSASAKNKFNQSALIMSALFGCVRPQDLIAKYRLSGDSRLPKVGTASAFWKKSLSNLINDDFIIDFRSGTYEKFWSPQAENENYLNIRIVQLAESDGNSRKIAVSHFNKRAKGRIVREIVSTRKQFSTAEVLANFLASKNWEVELLQERNGSQTLEVLIHDVAVGK